MATRITRDEINALPDMLTNDAFVLTFGSIPGETENRRLSLQCKAMTIPGEQNATIEQMIAGFQIRQSGTRKNSGTFTATFVETYDMAVLKRLRNWKQHVRGTRTGSSIGYSQDYSVNALLEVFDTAGNKATSCTIYKVFPSDIPDINLDSGNDATAVEVQVTFTYNYPDYEEATLL